MLLKKAVQGSTHTPQPITFINNNQQAIDISTAVLTGLIYTRNGVSTPITGQLVPDPTNAVNGLYTWTYSADDVATPNQYLVQVKATFDNTPDPDTIEYDTARTWIVESPVPGAQFDFTYDISTLLGQIRLHIGDTDLGAGPYPGRFNFLDTEIEHFMSVAKNNLNGSVITALMTLASVWSNFATSEWLGQPSIKIDTKNVAKEYRAQADWLYKNPLDSVDKGRWRIEILPRRDAYTATPRSGVGSSEFG